MSICEWSGDWAPTEGSSKASVNVIFIDRKMVESATYSNISY